MSRNLLIRNHSLVVFLFLASRQFWLLLEAQGENSE